MKKVLFTAACLLTAGSAMANWGTLEDPVAVFPPETNDFGCTYSAGKEILWSVIYDAVPQEDGDGTTYAFMLQGVRMDGSLVFPEGGKQISKYGNLSFTLINNFVYTDRDDNAIVMICDLRNSDEVAREFCFTLYKVSPDGEMLWGDDGISPNSNSRIDGLSATQACQLQDGSYVVCWQDPYAGESYMQRISEDGTKLYWGLKGRYTSGLYPILIPAEDNQAIMVYYDGAIKVTKLDQDSDEAWPEPVTVYPYGFENTTIPPYLFFDAVGTSDGGVLVYWRDDRNNRGYYSPYMSYVTPNGKLAFAGSSDEGDCKLSTTQMYSAMGMSATPDPDGDGFIAMWTTGFINQNNYGGMCIQRVTKEGELEWGDEGITFEEPTTETHYTPGGIQPDDKGNLAFFYEWSQNFNGLSGYNNMGNNIRLLNAKTAEPVWEEDVELVAEPCHVQSLASYDYPEEKCWLATWTRGTYSTSEVRLVQRISYEGEIATGEINSVASPIVAGELHAAVFGNSLSVNVAEATTADVTIYDLTGGIVLSLTNHPIKEGYNRIDLSSLNSGNYIATINTMAGNATLKFRR